jgi:hypothetical protein
VGGGGEDVAKVLEDVAKKYLVWPPVFTRNTNLLTLQAMYKDKKDILTNPKLSFEEKNMMMGELNSAMKTFKNRWDMQEAAAMVPPASSTKPSAGESGGLTVEEIVEDIDTQKKKNEAIEILRKLQAKGVQWTADGQIVDPTQGRLKDSDIQTAVTNLVYNRDTQDKGTKRLQELYRGVEKKKKKKTTTTATTKTKKTKRKPVGVLADERPQTRLTTGDQLGSLFGTASTSSSSSARKRKRRRTTKHPPLDFDDSSDWDLA